MMHPPQDIGQMVPEIKKPQEYERMTLITRWVILGLAFIFSLFPEVKVDKRWFYAILAAAALFFLVYYHLLPKYLLSKYIISPRRHILEFFLDAVGVTAIIWITDVHMSPLFFFYFLLIAGVAFLYGKKAAFLSAASITVIFGFLFAIEFLHEYVSPFNGEHILHFSILVASLWLVAFLSGGSATILDKSLRGQVLLAVKNKKLYEAQKKEAQRFAVINKISRVASSTLDMVKVCTTLAKELKGVVNFDRISVSLLDETGENVDAYAITAAGKVVEKKKTQPKDVCCAEWVTKHKKPLMRPDLEHGIHFETDETIVSQGIKTCFSLPLMVRGEVIGTFCLYNKKKAAYSDEDVKILIPLAEQLSIAIENANLYEKVKQQAITDPLTSLYNYGYFQQFLAKEFTRAKRYKKDLSVVMLDLDGFKNYNDTFGHPEGDIVLKRVGKLLKESVRETDIAARYGGDEFVLVLPETGVQGANIVAQRIQAHLKKEEYFNKGRGKIRLGVSIGVAFYPGMAENKDELVKIADDFLYGTKRVKHRSPVPA